MRINTGGPATTNGGNDYLADIYYDTGTVLVRPQTGLVEPFSSIRYSRSQKMAYAIPLENGDYTINLYFAELWFGATGGGSGGTGSRVFDVLLESKLELDDFDVYAEVGAETVLKKSFQVTVMDGELNIDFSSLSADGGVKHPTINAIEILGISVVPPLDQLPLADSGPDVELRLPETQAVLSGSGSDPDGGTVSYLWTQQSGPSLAGLSGVATDELAVTGLEEGEYVFRLTVTDDESESASDDVTVRVSAANTPNDFSMRINTGGGNITFNDENWISDDYWITNSNTFNRIREIGNTENDELYHSERYAKSSIGEIKYEIPVNDIGFYDINLHFVELYFGVDQNNGGIGSRIFSVEIENGQGILENYDITRVAGGALIAVVEPFKNILVEDGFLTISLKSIFENAKISGIEIQGAKNDNQIQKSVSLIELSSLDKVVGNETDIYKSQKIGNKKLISIYPNPTAFQANIQIDTDAINITDILLYDSSGRLVRREKFSGIEKVWNGQHSLDISNLEVGVYFALLMDGNIKIGELKVVKVN